MRSPISVSPALSFAMTNTSVDAARIMSSVPDRTFKFLTLSELRLVSARLKALFAHVKVMFDKGIWSNTRLTELACIMHDIHMKHEFVADRRRALICLKKKYPRCFDEGGRGLPPSLFGIPFGV